MLYCRITRLDTRKREIKKKKLHHVAVFRMEYLPLSRSRSALGVGVGVYIFGPESELESDSLEIRRLRNPDELPPPPPH